MKRGYLTMAVGRASFLEMAVDMALSLRDQTDLPVAIVTDETLEPLVAARYGGVFDAVSLLPRRFRVGRALKYGVARSTPFEETTFVDADCVVLGSLEHMWAALVGSDVVLLGEQLTRQDDENHHGFSTRSLMRRFDLDRYLKTNSGLFCFRREPAIEIMDEILECYLQEVRPRLKWSILRGAWVGDEIAIGIVGGRRGLGTLAKPAEMYWPHEFDALDLARPTKPLLHLVWPPPDAVVEELMEAMRERRHRAGVPGDGEEHWRGEVEKLQSMRRRRRILERIGWW